MKKRTKDEKGFTLIEMIATLVLVGITAAVAGMWIVTAVNGYFFTRTNASIAQKAQLAMTRLTREFSAIQTVTAASATGITYTRTGATLSAVPVTLSQNGSALQLNVNNTGAQTLVDSVFSIAFRYCNTPTAGAQICGTSWATTSKVIEFTLTLTAGNNTPVAFTKRVTPRNL